LFYRGQNKLHGLLKQSKFEIKEPIEGELEKMKVRIDSEIAELRKLIDNTEAFKSASPKEKQKYSNPPKALLVKFEHIIDKAGLANTRVSAFWKLASNYAHSEYIADRQYFIYYGPTRANHIAKNGLASQLSVMVLITSRIISLLLDKYPSTVRHWKSLPEKEQTYFDLLYKLSDKW